MRKAILRTFGAVLCLMIWAVPVMAGEIDDPDQWQKFNRGVFEFNQRVDQAVLKPIAVWTKKWVPKPALSALSNILSNLGDFSSGINSLLQLKFRHSIESFSRVMFNTTIGLGGVLDVASGLGLPRHEEDLSHTLAWWGVPEGPYLVLPFLGPGTVLDHLAFFGAQREDHALEKVLNLDHSDLFIPRALQARLDLLAAENFLFDFGDPYLTVRDAYLQNRRYRVAN